MHLKETHPYSAATADATTTPAEEEALQTITPNLNITLTHKDDTTVTSTTLSPSPPPKERRPLYFAYGSNLSPTQMRTRCTHNPTLSSRPVAIARLPHWRWFICESGYANVVPPASLRTGKQIDQGEKIPVSGDEDAVFGVLYDMDVCDERLLDGYEGVDYDAPPAREGAGVPRDVRPREQGRGDYNKWVVLGAEVVRWLDGDGDGEREGEELLTLVYVDEERVRCGPPKKEYIPRMNRAMREAGGLGFPLGWAEEVMRPYIPRE